MRKKQKQLYVALVRKFILVVLFSDEKIVSICACGNISPYTGYVQYRYGTPNHIEMIFPQEKILSEKRIFVVNASEGSVSEDIIKFKGGSCTYLVSQMSASNLTVIKTEKWF